MYICTVVIESKRRKNVLGTLFDKAFRYAFIKEIKNQFCNILSNTFHMRQSTFVNVLFFVYILFALWLSNKK